MTKLLELTTITLAILLSDIPSLFGLTHAGLGSKDETNLVRKLFNGTIPYNPLIRPAIDISDIIKVKLSLSFIQLISVDERNQVMKSNIWLNIQWRDFQLVWNATDYGGIQIIRMIPEMVWQPDIVLFNNADGKYEVSYKSRVLITNDGLVQYIPPAIFRSSCRIDVKYFPFDQQSCELKFGSWTFNADQVDLDFANNFKYVDLSDYVISGTWDVIDCPGIIRKFRGSRSTPNKTRIDFKIVLRRKTLFYTVNLIIPCVLISLLSICVFYLPADEGEKMTLSISILLALVVFLLLLQKILPPTSTSIPLIASYLLFTMILNVFSILITVVIINCSFRTPRTHTMPQWVYTLFVEKLSKILLMSRQKTDYQRGSDLQAEAAVNTFATLEGNMDCVINATEYGNAARNNSDNNFVDMPFQNRRRSSTSAANLIKDNKNNNSKMRKHILFHNFGAANPEQGFGQPPSYEIRQQQQTSPKSDTSSPDNWYEEPPSSRKRSSSQHHVTFDASTYGATSDDTYDYDFGNKDEKIWISFEDQLEQLLSSGDAGREIAVTQELYKSVKAIRYIARHIRQSDAHDAVLKDWKYIGLVMDRLLLIIFLLVTISGTIGIFMESPHIFDFVDQQEVIDRLNKAKQAASK